MRIAPYTLAGLQNASGLLKESMGVFLPDAVENLVINYTIAGLAMQAVDRVGTSLGNVRINESSSTKTDQTNIFSSNVNVAGSMMTNSVGDTTISASNLNIGTNPTLVSAGGGNFLTNSSGNFTINAALQTTKHSETNSYETAGQFHSHLNVGRANYRAGVIKEIDENGNEFSSSTLISSNINVAGSTIINSSDQFALTASNLITSSSTEINSLNNLNISDASNKLSTSAFDKKLTIDVGIQAGNAFVDAAQSGLDAVDALKKVKDAKDKLDRIEKLHNEDRASSTAVERAKYQVALAMFNAGMMTFAAFQAAKSAAAASKTAGFYGNVYADITKTNFSSSSNSSQSFAANLISGEAVNLSSGSSDINITGSNVKSINGDLNVTAMLGNINIKAGESTYSQETKSSSRTIGGSIGTNGTNLHLGFNQAGSNLDQTTYANATLNAENGTLKLNSKQDTNIIGANSEYIAPLRSSQYFHLSQR